MRVSEGDKLNAVKQEAVGLPWVDGFAVLSSAGRGGLPEGSALGRALKRPIPVAH